MLILLSILSCSKGDKTEETTQSDPVSNEFRVYNLTREAPKIKLVDLIERAEVMRLEETSSSQLAYIAYVQQMGDHIILAGLKEQTVYSFSLEGNYLSSFNHLGDAPHEYRTIGNLWSKGDTVCIYDTKQSSIKKYSMEGVFLKEDQLPFSAKAVHPTPDGYVTDMSNQLLLDSLKYRFAFLDKDLKLKSFKGSFEEINQYRLGSDQSTFFPYGEDLVHKSHFNDTIYFIESGEIHPLMKLNFGDEYYWQVSERRTDIMKALTEFADNDQVFLISPKVGKKHIVANVENLGKQKTPPIWIDRKSGDFKQIDLRKINGEYDVSFRIWSGDLGLMSIASTDVSDFLEELGPGKWNFMSGTTLEEIESSENPVLMWVKFKRG